MAIHRIQGPDGRIHRIEGPDNATPEQLFSVVQQQLDQEYLEKERRSQTGLFETGTRAVKRGFQELGATVTDIIPAAVGSAFGFEDYAKEQLKEAEKKREGWEAEAPTLFKSYKDVEGIGDFPKFVVETLGGQVANIGTALIPGIGGGVLAGRMAAAPVARAITADAVKKGLTKEATEEAVKRGVQAAAPGFAGAVGTGQAAGAFLGSYALSAPEIFENIYQETGQLEPGAAALFSVGAAALDSILPATLARQLTMPAKIGIVEKVLEKSGMDKGLLRSMTAGLLQAIPTEALTEGTQEAISIAAERFVDENPKVFGSKEWDRIMESAVRGAVAGGGFGVVGGGVEGLRARGEVARERELNEELERLRRIDEEEAKQVSPDQLKEQAYFDELNRQAGADQAGLRTDTERQTRIAEIEAELASLQASQAQMQLPGMEMGPATGLVTPPVPSKPGKEPKATQAEMFTAEGELTPQMEKAAVRDQKAAEKQQKEREAQFKKDQQELKARLEELAPPKNLVSLAKTPTQLQQTVLQAQQDLDKIAKKRGAAPQATTPAVVAPAVATATTPQATTPAVAAPVSLESIQKIDDPVAFGKLLGIGRTALILKPDGPLAGLDISTPEGASAAKEVLEAYASGDRSKKLIDTVTNYITTRLDPVIAKGAPDAARTDIQAGGEGVGVSDQGVGGAAAAPVESVERGGVDVVGGNVSQPAGREAPQPGALGDFLAPEKYYYHAVRNVEDIPDILKNGLRPGTNLSANTQGQAFTEEGATVLVFRKEDVQAKHKGYQDDYVVENQPRPVGILKDTSTEEYAGQKEELDWFEKWKERDDKLEARKNAYANTMGMERKEFDYLLIHAGTRAKKQPALFKEYFGEYADNVKEMWREGKELARILDRETEREAGRQRPVTTKEQVLEKYAQYGLPVEPFRADYNEDTNQVEVKYDKPTEAAPKEEAPAPQVPVMDRLIAITDFEVPPQAPAPQAEIPDEAKRILNRVDTQIDQLLTSRANETLDNEGLSREELPIKQYRGTDVHNALRVPRLLAEYERLRGKPEPRTVAVRDGIEQTLSAISPDVAQFIERFKQASPAQRQAVLAELNRSAMEQFDSAMRFIVGDIRETAAQQGVKPLRAKTEPRVEKAKRRGMMMKEAEVLLNDYAQKFEKKTGKKLFLPKYEGPVFDDVQRRLAESGDVGGLLRNLLDSIQDPAIKQVLRRIRSLNLKTKIKIGDPTGAMALPAQFKVTAAAFRNVFSGKVYETGNMHRMDLLPAEERNKPSGTMEAGFVGNDGKFYNRKEVANKINRADLIEDINQEVHSSNLLPREDVKTQRQLSAFRDWFGDSKVVDAQGKPLVVYQGMPGEMEGGEFRESKYGTLGEGIYFTNDPEAAGRFAMSVRGSNVEPKAQGSTVPVYLKMEMPFDDEFFVGNKEWQEWAASILRSGNKPNDGLWPLMTRWRIGTVEYTQKTLISLHNKLMNGEATLRDLLFIGKSDAETPWSKEILDQIKAHGDFDGVILKDSPKGFSEYLVYKPTQIKSAIGNRGTFDPTNPDIRYAQNKAGSYDPITDTITLDPTNGLNAHTFLHETLHAAISNVLENRSHPLTKQFEKFFVSIQDRLGAAYGATDLQEFAAELISNPSFQAVLKTIKAPKSENMFVRIMQTIAEFFGFAETKVGKALLETTALNRGLKFINDAIDITNDVPATDAQRLFLGDGTNQSKVIREIAEAQPSLAGRTLEDTKNFLSNLKGRDLQQLAFGLLRLDNIRDIYRKQLPSIKNLLDALEKRMGTEERSIERATNNFNRFLKVQRKHPAAMRAMDELSIEISDAQVDVTAAQFIARVADPKMNQRQKDEFDAAEAQRKRDYIELKKKFNALPEDVQDVYRTIRKDYDEAFNRYRAILEQAAEGSPALIAQLREEFTLKQPLIGYVPYRRYGDFWVEFTDPDTDAPVAMAFESIRERELFIKNDLQGIAHQKYDKIDNIQFDQNRIPPTHFLNDVVTKLRKEGASDAQVNSVYQAYLAAFPAESIAKQFIKRKGTRGMEKDLIRNYNDLMVRWARKLANSEYSPQVDRALIQIAQEARASGDSVVGAAAQNIQAQSAFFHNPTFGTLVSAGTQLSYFEFMAGNISSALINLTSLPLMVYPLLTGKFGWGKASGAMLAAGKTAINNWGESERYKALYDKLNDHGQLQHTMAREVLEARRVKTEEYTNLKGKVLNLLSIPFSISERYNRGVTAIAAYDLALENGMTKEQALDYALETVKTAHTSGTIATGPRWMQTPLGRVFFTFKSFIWNSAYVIARAFHQAVKGESAEVRAMARRQLLATYGMATVFAGTKGMPFYGAISVMAEMLNALFGDDDEPFDFDEFMRDVFGDFLHKGAVNALLNLEVANRAGLATDLIFRDDPRGVAENGYVLTAMQQAFGPVGSILVNSGRAVEMFKDGHIARALETAGPSFYRNASKGVRYMLEGATTLKGDPIDEDINAWNTTMQLIGFSPADLSNRYEMISMAKGFERQVELRRRDALRLYDMAIRSGDTELLAEARERIREFNQAQPKYRITQDSLNRSQRAREAAEKELIYGIRFNKNLRGEIKERFFEDEEE